MVSKELIRVTGENEHLEGAPELAVEVVSPSDSAQDLSLKVDQYLGAGTKQVWVLYPKVKRVHVFYSEAAPSMLDATQTLLGADVVPGFSVK